MRPEKRKSPSWDTDNMNRKDSDQVRPQVQGSWYRQHVSKPCGERIMVSTIHKLAPGIHWEQILFGDLFYKMLKI